ncbi:iron-containing alcohol dehydrogenase [Anaerotruncus rubiinfantis]|uniref:iron-containing alcohol dehydrogenase n=1 Tax=Anaerotruncus rubiinfantis TaxID=1720200 RepID=UPI00082A48D4|nr:iron-containing alcohol dehydrogenase [Anaerotruncus rubiinfantis]
MFTIDSYLPTRIVFGYGRLKELASMELPGKKALICVTEDGLMAQLGVQQRVESLLRENGTEYVLFDRVCVNPPKSVVEAAVAVARENGCDFMLGLGGGASIDVAKAAAAMMVNDGDLWDYGYTGTGGRRELQKALPIVTISTTCGTGTETDQYCVITHDETREKLDFTSEAIFPTISIIDPELMMTLPRSLTIMQGFDALFHNAECYVTNGHRNRLLDLYSADGVKVVAENLTKVVNDPTDAQARTNLAYAADILGGYSMALDSVTSHHILAQTLGGYYPGFPHGATLIVVAEAYYKRVCSLLPDEFDELGELMGETRDPANPGYAYVKALIRLLDETGARSMKMSEYGVKKEDFQKIVDMTVDQVGIALDRYQLTKQDFMDMLEESYR